MRERQPSKTPTHPQKSVTLEGCLSLNSQWPMKSNDIYGLYGRDEHAALTQQTLKAEYIERIFFKVTTGVALMYISRNLSKFS